VLIDTCWTWRNGSNVWASGSFNGNGNGFKLGGNFVAAAHRLVRSVAYQNVGNNGGKGIDQNNNTGSLTIDNNTSWGNRNADINMNTTPTTSGVITLRNNLVISGTTSIQSSASQISNSWQVISSPPANSNDVLSMDASLLAAPRQADGSLPVTALVHPVPGGRLVDKGYNFGDPYYGSAPDLGAYETAGATPVAAFTGTPTNGAAPLAVTFTDSSTGSITNRFWDFGDGNTSNTTATTMNHTYNAGTFTVSLTVSGSSGSSTNIQSSYIVATNLAPPVAGFTANPATGTEPLIVTFTDTSTGTSPLSLSWNLGDSTTNTTGGASFTHGYAAGTYTVTLTVSNSAGVSTLVSNNLITVVTAFQTWQQQFFSCANCPQADANADPDGDGQSNQAEFLAGTDPTNSLSALRIISAAMETDDVRITWATAGGHTNVVQVGGGNGDGGYSTNFTDIGGLIVIPGSGDTTTNYLDLGAATNTPSRYYRIRLIP
jgi:PKD repeat protein